jgi:thiosulfate/3-mercaptopyruvate sulfurtransferase
MSPLIEYTDLQPNAQNTILIDARGGKDAYQRYLAGHLPNALYADLDHDLAAHTDNPSIGGRHPLPDVATFAKLLGNWGITPDSHVVIYDDKSGAMSAARLWWMLRAIGHQNVQVLNGGLAYAISQGTQLSTEEYKPAALAPYPATAYAGTVDIDKVAEATQDAGSMVIDVREAPRYLGQTEPLDLVAGHIPGAYNLPYIGNLGPDGRYLPAETLRKAYDELIADVPHDNVIVHCGSGVTACHTLLGMDYAGILGPQLYIGSWSEWSRTGRPQATSERM